MLFSEPPRTQGDLNFRLFGIPVRVHPFFWLVVFFLGMSVFEIPDLRVALLLFLPWVAAFFISILWHELGHAFTMRAYGFRPWVTLHGFGGLASYDPSAGYASRGQTSGAQILISFAGPGAGFLLAGIIIGVVYLSGHHVLFALGGTFGVTIEIPPIVSSRFAVILTLFADSVVRICMIWGILNLLPIYPLDGGHISRELFLLTNPRDGIRQSLILSILAATALAVLVMYRTIDWNNLSNNSWHDLLVPVFFGYLAYSSFEMLQSYTNQRRY